MAVDDGGMSSSSGTDVHSPDAFRGPFTTNVETAIPSARRVLREIRDRHLTREHERHRAREEAHEDQDATDCLDHAGRETIVAKRALDNGETDRDHKIAKNHDRQWRMRPTETVIERRNEKCRQKREEKPCLTLVLKPFLDRDGPRDNSAGDISHVCRLLRIIDLAEALKDGLVSPSSCDDPGPCRNRY